MSMMSEQTKKEIGDQDVVLRYIAENEPVTQTEVRNNVDGKVILSLRRLLDTDAIKYDDQYNFVIDENE